MKRFLSVLALVMALGPPALSAQTVTDTVEVVGVSEIVAIRDDCPRNSADKIQGKVGDTIFCTLAAVDAQGDTVLAVFSVVAEQPDKLTAEVAGDALTLIILRNGSSRIFRTAAPAGVEPPPPDTLPPPEGAVFSEGFESGDLSRQYDGHDFWADWSTHTAVTTENPRTGQYALQFTYLAQDDPANESTPHSWSEQRFYLRPDGEVYGEHWVEFYLFLPVNMTHHGSGNHKYYFLWDEGTYPGSVTGPKVAGNLTSWADSLPPTDISSSEAGVGSDSGWLGRWEYKDGFVTDAHRGTWVQFRWHYRTASSDSALDGEFQIWRNGESIAHGTGLDFYRADFNGIGRGYLMGWHQGGYLEETTYFLDDLTLYLTDPGW
jgi:hypothetical protein